MILPVACIFRWWRPAAAIAVAALAASICRCRTPGPGCSGAATLTTQAYDDLIDTPRVVELARRSTIALWQYPSWACGGLGGAKRSWGNRESNRELQVQLAAARAGVPTNSVYTSRVLKNCPTEFTWVTNPQLEDGVLYLLAPDAVQASPALTALARSNACVTLDWGVVCSRRGCAGRDGRAADAAPRRTTDVARDESVAGKITVAAHALPRDAGIYVAGHRGLVGSAIIRRLTDAGFTKILGATRDQLDLRDQAAVNYWFKANRPDYVFLVAGTVGGILANSTRPAEFIYDNLMIHATVVEASRLHGVEAAAVSGQLVRLSAGLPAADPRALPAQRPARTDQRAVRDGEDLRHPALPGVSPAVWLRLHLGDADEPLRARATTSIRPARTSFRR